MNPMNPFISTNIQYLLNSLNAYTLNSDDFSESESSTDHPQPVAAPTAPSTISIADRIPNTALNTLQPKLIGAYLTKLNDEYQCCYFLTLEKLCEFILLDQFITALKFQHPQCKSKSMPVVISKFRQMVISGTITKCPDILKKELLPLLQIPEDDKTKITSAVNFASNILSNQNLLNDKACFYYGTSNNIDIGKGIEKIYTLQKELYLHIKPILNLEKTKLMGCNGELFEHRNNIRPSGFFDPTIETKLKEKSINGVKEKICSIHALTQLSENSTLQLAISLLDKDHPQNLCQSTLLLLLKQSKNFSSKIQSECTEFENYLTRIETGTRFMFKLKQNENSKAFIREFILCQVKAQSETLIDIHNICRRIFMTTQDISHESIENSYCFSILREILVYIVDQKNEDLKSYIKTKFSLSDSSPLIPLIVELYHYFDNEVPEIAQRCEDEINEIHNRHMAFIQIGVDPHPSVTFCKRILTKVDVLISVFDRDQTYYKKNKSSPHYLLYYLNAFTTDLEQQGRSSAEGDNVISCLNFETFGLSETKIPQSQKKLGITSLELTKRMQSSISSIRAATSLLYGPFFNYLEQITPFLKTEEIDLGALWIQSLEREERELRLLKPNPDQNNRLAKVINPTAPKEIVEIDESESLIEPLPQLPSSSPQTRKLSSELFSTKYPLIEISNHISENDVQKIFSYDLAYHLELFTTSLDALQLVSSSVPGTLVGPLISLCLNSYYHALEQAITPRFISDHYSMIDHGISQKFSSIYESNQVWNDLDKMTLWYRYPNFSLHFNRNYQMNTPVALQLTLASPNSNQELFTPLASLFMKSIEALMSETATHLPQQSESLSLFKQQVIEKMETICHTGSDTDSTELSGLSDSKLTPQRDNFIQIRLNLNMQFQVLLDQLGEDSTAAVTYRDLQLHLDRFASSLQLLAVLKEQKFLHLHSHALLITGQYIAEHCFVLLSIANKTEMRSHDFTSYTQLLNLEHHYSSHTLKFINDYLFLKKGCDYPFWTLYRKNIKGSKGMNLLRHSFALAQEDEGFVPKGMKANALGTHHIELGNLIDGVTAFLKETVNVASAFMHSDARLK